jgi:hypothetical protein
MRWGEGAAMGERNDDVIEDTGTPPTTGTLPVLDPPLKIWVSQVLPVIGQKPTESGGTEGTGTGSTTDPVTTTVTEEVPKGPTPAQLMLASVNEPRPMDLSVPEGANGEETGAIDLLHSKLVEHLKGHDGGSDLTVAQGMVVSIKEAIAKVPLRIAQEIEQRREKVRGSLALLKLPEGLPETERVKLSETGTSLEKSIDEAKTLVALDELNLAVTSHGDKLRQAGEAVALRKQKAQALQDRIGKAVPSDQALPTEVTPLKERGQALLLRLAPPLTDDGLLGVTTDTGVLEQEVLNLATQVGLRGEKAETLRQRLLKITAAPGLPQTEATSFGLLVTAAGDEIKAPYSPDMLDKAEKRAGELELQVQQQIADVDERGKRAEVLAQRLKLITAPPRVTPEEAEDLRKSVEAANLQLKPPHAVLTLDGVEKAAGELEGRAKTLGETVVKRDERATAVTEKMKLLTDPPGLNDTEKQALKLAREAATGALVDPPTEAALILAEQKAVAADALHKDTAKAISDREIRRKELTDKLDKIDIPATARPTDFRLRAKAGAEIRKAIIEANATDALDKAEQAVAAELKTVTELALFIQERVLAENELAAARNTLAAAEKTADQGYITKLRNTIFDAAKVIPGVSTVAELAKPRKAVADVLLLQVQSETYSAKFRDFLTASAACEAAAAGTDKPTIKAAITKVRLAAQAKSVTCDYVGAGQELAKFETEAGLGTTALSDAKLWIDNAKAFSASHEMKLKLIKGSQVPDGPRLLPLVATARLVPAAGASVPNAIIALNNHKPAIDGLYNVAVLWQRYKSQKTNALPLAGVNLALANATGHLNAQAYPQAVTDFDPLKGTAFETKGADKERLDKLRGRKDSLLSRLVDPHKAFLSGKWSLANTAVTSGTSSAANSAMDVLEDLLGNLENWVPAANEVKALAAKFLNTYQLVDAADNKATANQYDQAVPLLATAKTKLTALAEALDLLARAEALRDAQAATTPPQLLCIKAVTDANQALTTDKDPDKAVGLLKPLFTDPVLKVMAADIAVWQARYPVAKKATDRAAGMMDLPLPKQVLVDSLAAAQTQATAHKYREALDLLDQHEPVLKLSASYASVRKRALGMFAALLRAETEFPGETAKIYGGKGKVALVKIRDDAEDLAAKKDFGPAIKAFTDLIDECKTQAFETAQLFEAKDALNTNAGHALESHGAHTKEEDHLARLQTGIAPDGRASLTKTTTQFTDPAAFLASREAAMAGAAIAPPPPAVDFTATDFPLNVDEKLLKKTVPVDHGAGIGKALIGVKLSEQLMPDGSVVEADRKFETWQNLDGISKSKTLFTFEFDSPDPTVNPRSPKNVEDYKKRYKEQFERDVLAGIPRTGTADVPPKLPGRWVCMQNFPEAAGWDQEKGEYVD